MSTLDRPTFHESWYRVAAMRPRLRPAVQTRRQAYRGRLWHVIRDPVNNQFFRVDDAGYEFIGLLNGRRTVGEVWQIANDHLGDRAPTQGEAIQLLGQLYSSNLLLGDVPADAAGMFDRQTKRVRREIGGYLKNVMFVRFPLIDPDALLERWVGVFGWLFSPVGIALWWVLLAAAGWHLTGRWGELVANAQPQSMLKPENLVLLYLCFAAVKAVHELGHGFACKHFGRRDGTGGEVHTIGIMLLVFMPVPYVDATSSWAFRSKWQRMFVAAAGMYVELGVAAIAAIVWAYTGADTLVHDIAYNVMFIASVSTLLFNANPLLRYDGYYILSDAIEMPNLAQRSKDYLQYLVRRYAYGVRQPRNPSHGAAERPWLVTYGIAAAIYRVFIFAVILLYVAGMMFFIGVLMAIVGVVTMFLVPLGKWIKYLMTSPELQRTRSRAVGLSVALIVGAIAAIGLPRAPDRCRAEGIVEPARLVYVSATEGGLVTDVLPSATPVTRGEHKLLRAQSPPLQSELSIADAERKLAEAEWRRDRVRDPALAQAGERRLRVAQRIAARAAERVGQLELTAPATGTWLSPHIDRLPGAYVQAGDPVGVIADTASLRVRVVADQRFGPLIQRAFDNDRLSVSLRVKGRPDLAFTGRVSKVLPAGRRDLPSAALGLPAGGSTALDPNQPDQPTAAKPVFEVHITPDTAGVPLLAGQRVVARFDLPDQPLMAQWYRALRQLVQERFTI